MRSEGQAAVVRVCRASKVAGAIWPRAECRRRGVVERLEPTRAEVLRLMERAGFVDVTSAP